MKKPKITPEKPAPKTKAEEPVAIVATKVKEPVVAVKSKAEEPAAAVKAKVEEPAAIVEAKTTAKKPSPVKKAPKKATAAAPKAVVAEAEISVHERVGLTAGNIWHYLDENGATPVAKLIRELPEDEKIIQRSIGWLAQEGKLTFDTVDRVETISL